MEFYYSNKIILAEMIEIVKNGTVQLFRETRSSVELSGSKLEGVEPVKDLKSFIKWDWSKYPHL